MSIEFKPDCNSALDASSEVRISFPRILPATLSDGSEAIEYQYTFRRDGERVASLGILGTENLSVQGSVHQRIYTLDLSASEVLDSILRFKERIENSDDPAPFVRAVAQGLLNVFSNQSSTSESVRYVAFARVDSLIQHGMAIAEDSLQLRDGVVLLARLLVPQQRVEVG